MKLEKWLLSVAIAILLFAAVAGAAPAGLNPCQAATARCVAGDKLLEVTYALDLHNPSGETVEAVLLPAVDVLTAVTGAEGEVILSRRDGALHATVPGGWQGRITLQARQKISRRPGSPALTARVSMPEAAARSITFEAAGRSLRLKVSPEAIVTPGPSAPDGAQRFSVVPLQGTVFRLEWREAPPAGEGRYSVREVHHIAERAPAFDDHVTLKFKFHDTPPEVVQVVIPEGVSLLRVEISPPAAWKIAGDRLELRVPAGLAGKELAVACALEGGTTPDPEKDGQLLAVPLFVCPDAERHVGQVLVSGALHELSFSVLHGATQAAAEGDTWRLACDLGGAGAEVVVKITSPEDRPEASIVSHYQVSAFGVAGIHRVTFGKRLRPVSSLEIVLGPGEVARLADTPLLRSWHQDGRSLRIQLDRPALEEVRVRVTTERLTGSGKALRLTPLAAGGATLINSWTGIRSHDDIVLKPGGEAESWRVPPGTVPALPGVPAATIGYRFGERPAPIELAVLPVRPELRGHVEDHVTVYEDRVLRESLFLLEMGRQAADELAVVLPSGLTVERVDGPGIEGWDVTEDGAELTVRFGRPVLGRFHFRLVCTRPVVPGRLTLTGIYVKDAPRLKGWLGISSDVSVALRPVEDGVARHLDSTRTELAPEYLKAFDNRFLYELYDGRWELGLEAEALAPLYAADVLNVLRFHASQVEAMSVFNIRIEQGAVSDLSFQLPANAAAARVEAPGIVQSRLLDGTMHVRFDGKRSGALQCRVYYYVAAGAGETSIEVAPVRLVGARAESGLVLLAQAEEDVEIKLGAVPAALRAAEPRGAYPAWSFELGGPAVAAYTYRDADWRLPVASVAHRLSKQMLQANIPLAKLDTLVRSDSELLNHLRLYVANTTMQFLTVDLAALHPEARLIGTYVYGEPVKPFREGKTRLQIPLFTSEKAARVGMSMIDITYSAPHGGLDALRKLDLAAPDLGLNVGQLEWTLRMPEGDRVVLVGGNMDKPVTGIRADSLAGRLLKPLMSLLRRFWWVPLALMTAAGVLLALYQLGRVLAAQSRLRKALATALVLLIVLCIVAAMLMPALQRAQGDAKKSNERSNLHNIGLGIAMYRNDHKGQSPPDLSVLLERGYLDGAEAFQSPSGRDIELVYRRPKPGAGPAEATAYFLHPDKGGANVLFLDGAVQWVLLEEGGKLVNPRTGKLVATAPEPKKQRKVKWAAGAQEADELAQALELGAEIQVQTAGRPVSRAEQQERIDKALIEANREKLAKADRDYRAEHEGKGASSPEDLAAYIENGRLVEALNRTKQMMPAINRARLSAMKSNERSNVHNIGLGISEYRDDHKGEWAPSIDVLVKEGYIEDEGVLISPEWDDEDGTFVYIPQKADPPPGRAIGYFWPPQKAGMNVLFADNATLWVPRNKEGQIVNPRTGELIATVTAAGKKKRPMSKEDLAASRYNLGLAFLEQGDYDGAEKNFQQALDLKDDYAVARRQLAQTRALRKVTQLEVPADEEAQVGQVIAGEDLRELELTFTRREREAKGAEPLEPQFLDLGSQTIIADGVPLAGLPLAPQRRARKSLAKRLGSGRSVGALPITIDFPAPATSDYQFVKPFLGRTGATISFRTMRRRTALLAELALAALMLLAYALLRRRHPARAVSFAGPAFCIALALYLATSAMIATVFAATCLAMGACLAGEAITLCIGNLRKPKPEVS